MNRTEKYTEQNTIDDHKPGIGKFKNNFGSNICLILVCIQFLACGSGNSTFSTENSKKAAALNKKSSITTEDAQNSIHCNGLENQVDEIQLVILNQEQIYKQASQQAIETCQADSPLDCNFWTERANRLSKGIREKRDQLQHLLNQKYKTNVCKTD